MPTQIDVNTKQVRVDVDLQTPLLWVLRDELGLNGTKYGCGIAACGACTVHLDGEPARSCSIPLESVGTSKVVTIEGLASSTAQAVKNAWISEQVAQCGYCQSGQIMSAVALLQRNPRPSDADIDEAMQGNICRCATYERIRRAIHVASRTLQAAA